MHNFLVFIFVAFTLIFMVLGIKTIILEVNINGFLSYHYLALTFYSMIFASMFYKKKE